MLVPPTALVRAEEGGPFDLVNGIPVHPLVVHAAVVLVPLAALGVVAMALVPRLSRALGWLVVLTALGAAAASWVAKEAGEALEERVGEPGFDHADLGDVMPAFAAALLVAAAVLWLLDRTAREGAGTGRRVLRIAVAVLAVAVAVANVVWIYRVGDSGAKSVWTGRVASAPGASGADADEAAEGAAESDDDRTAGGADDSDVTGTTEGSSSDGAGYTLADVAARANAADCWAAIGGSVYDLTEWIDKHPGGAQRIIDLCGTDATAAFNGQHAGAEEPAEELADYVIGALG